MLIMLSGPDQSSELSVLDSDVMEVYLLKLTVQLEYFDHLVLL